MILTDTSLGHLPDSRASLVFDFTNNNELLWLNLSRLSLALYATIQILFFFLAFYRLIGAFRGQQRIESTLDKHHRFNGIGWITVGIMLGVIESIVGFATGGFAVPLSRRILRLTARSSLIIGVLKGWVKSASFYSTRSYSIHRVDSHETFEYLANKLPTWRRSMSLSSSNSWMVNRRFSRQASQRSHPSQEPSPTEKVVKGITGGQRVTVHYGTDQAPFLQIRFSTLNFPEPAVVADDNGVQSRTRSSLDPCDDLSQMYADQNTSAEIPTSRRHFKGNAMRESGYTISDNMSLVRELSLRFPLPPRVTGKYRGSILGQKYSDDDDEFPLVGISRGPSIRRDITQGAVAGNGNGVLSSNTGSIKRKPAPLLLHIPQPARTRERLVSSWGGLDTPNSLEYTSQSPATPSWPRPSVGSPLSTNMGDDEGCGTPQPRPRQLTPRRLFHHASRALSVVSIRSAEWLSSARPQPSSRPTPASIEAYYNGGTAIGPRRTYADPNDVRSSESGEGDDHRRSTDHDAALPGTPQSQIITHMSIGQVHTRMTPTPTLAQFPLGREPIASTYGEVQGWN